MTDLAREIAELLPCAWCWPGADVAYTDPRIINPSCACQYRPAILTYVQRKLDEAKANSELLAKVEKLITADHWMIVSRRQSSPANLVPSTDIVVSVHVQPLISAPTLAEALRKLVEEP